jgi:IS4 transposase
VSDTRHQVLTGAVSRALEGSALEVARERAILGEHVRLSSEIEARAELARAERVSVSVPFRGPGVC